MKKNFRKALAIVLSLAMVVTTFAFSSAKVNAAGLSNDEKTSIAGNGPMQNMFLGKTPIAYYRVPEGKETNLTNGNYTSDQCALSGGSGWGGHAEVYFTIDLGDYYKAESFDELILVYKNANANDTVLNRTYNVQYSLDGSTYNTVYTSGTITEFNEDNATVLDISSIQGKVRYIKVDYPTSADYGIQLREAAVLASDPEEAEIETCDDPAAVNASTSGLGKLTFNITAGPNQEDYTYVAMLDGDDSKVLKGDCLAGTNYTFDVDGGDHTVFVQSHYGEAISPGISSNQVRVETYETKATDATWNYAYGKNYTLSSGDSTEGNGSITNGIIASNDYATSNKGMAGSWMYVDLAKTYKASSFETVGIWFRVTGRGNAYPSTGGMKIQYSEDADTWVDAKEMTQAELDAQYKDKAPFGVFADVSEVTGVVRYVRMYIPQSLGWGAQVTEFGVFDIDNDAEEAAEEVVADPAGFTAESSDYNTITGTITAGLDQEDYTYDVFLDGNIAASNLTAGSFTINDIPSGTYDVTCKSNKNGRLSPGLTISDVKVSSREDWYADEDNVAPAGEIIACSSFYNENHTLSTAQHAIDGDLRTGEETDCCYRSANDQPVTIDIQLAKSYQINNLSKVLVGFSNFRTYAANATISVSSDGVNFTEVASDTGYVCTHDNTTIDVHLIEVNQASTDTFQYVRISLTGGTSTWGYVVNEIGIIASEGETPDNYMDVTTYKSTTPATYPTKEGMLFAGWYSDAEFTTPYMETTGYAYAKFIDEDVLGPVKFQVANDGSAIRFLSSLDSADYDSAGFIINGYYDGHTITNKPRQAKKLYQAVIADGKTVSPTIFSPDSNYFFTYTVTGLSADKIEGMTWNVTPYFVTEDGTKVTGTAGEYPVN